HDASRTTLCIRPAYLRCRSDNSRGNSRQSRRQRLPRSAVDSPGDLPSLRPGETHELTVVADFAERIMHLEPGAAPRLADVVRLPGSFSLLEADADPGSQFGFSPLIHIAAPVVELTLSLGQRTEMRERAVRRFLHRPQPLDAQTTWYSTISAT